MRLDDHDDGVRDCTSGIEIMVALRLGEKAAFLRVYLVCCTDSADT